MTLLCDRRKGREIGDFLLKINLGSAKDYIQWLWRMTEPPSLDQSRYKSDLEPGALLHWAMCLHCLTQAPSTDLMTAEAATKLIPRHREAYLTLTNLHNQLQSVCSQRASYFIIRGSKKEKWARQFIMPLQDKLSLFHGSPFLSFPLDDFALKWW